MDTKNLSSGKIPAVRTYARDLEANRKAKALVDDTSVSSTENTVPSPKVEPKKKIIENIKSEPKVPPAPKVEQAISLPPLSSLHKKKNPTKIIAINSKNSSFIVDENSEVGATIITDTKRDRFKLLPALIDSVKEWFSSKKTAYKAKKTPKYTVPESTRRKGVIQRATGVTGKLATSDFSSIHKRIKERKEKEDESEPTKTWSANTEPVFLLLQGPVSTPITNVQVVARKSFRAPEPKPKPSTIEETKPAEPEVIKPVPFDAPKVEVAEVMQEIQAQPTITSIDNQVVEIDTLPEIYEPETKSRFQLLLVNTNTLALGVSGLVLALIVTIIYSYFIFSREGAYITTNNDVNAELIIETPIKLASGDTNEKKSLLKVLKIIEDESNETVQIAFLFNGYNERQIPPQILLSIFDISVERSLAQSISTIRFGFTKSKSPFILMKVSDETVATGGLLNWEAEMADDLSDIFNFEEESLANIKFTDISVSGTDMRILKNAAGMEKIAYGIKNNIIIITSDKTNFTELVELIK